MLKYISSLFKDGFNNYQGKVRIDDTIFRYIVRVGKAKNDNIFYDVSLENLGTEKGTSGVPSTQSTSLLKKQVPLTANNISQSKTNVKLDTSSTKYSMQENINNTQELDNSSFSLKQKQLEIIQNNNPVQDDYHTWIRTIDDIKTFEETLEDVDYKEYYEDGEAFDDEVKLTINPDEGYELDTIKVINLSDDSEVTLTNYIFEMPESDVEVIATFKALPPTPDTYDGILLYVVIGSISLLGLILGLVSLKKRMN